MHDNRSGTFNVTSTGSGHAAVASGAGSTITQSSGTATDPCAGAPGATPPSTTNVFIVHGHDESMRERVALLLETLELRPVILREQTDGGRTLIEKLEHHALDAAFAVVLMTPDDTARGPGETDWPDLPNRARQNVILEMGYFMGKLGRARTAALYVPGTELPSDLHGLLYIPFDEHWSLRLAKEMKDAGLPVDLNRL